MRDLSSPSRHSRTRRPSTLALSPRRSAGRPTRGRPTWPARMTSPAGASRTAAPAWRQLRPTLAVTWSTWWRCRGNRWAPRGDRRGSPLGRTPGPDVGSPGESDAQAPGQGARQAKELTSDALAAMKAIARIQRVHQCKLRKKETDTEAAKRAQVDPALL